MKIILATDHAGFKLKESIKKYLIEFNYEIKDFGALEYNKLDDYPDFIAPAAKFISENCDYKGIIFGGSGQGEAISANRFKYVRAAVYYGGPIELVELSRIHNDANILSLGARFLSLDEAKNVINLWLNTNFEGERHLNRIKKIDEFC